MSNPRGLKLEREKKGKVEAKQGRKMKHDKINRKSGRSGGRGKKKRRKGVIWLVGSLEFWCCVECSS